MCGLCDASKRRQAAENKRQAMEDSWAAGYLAALEDAAALVSEPRENPFTKGSRS